MYTYQNDFSLKRYVKKRFLSIYPMFWVAYAIVFLFYLYKYYAINPFSQPAPKWTFLLSIIGMDGYYVALIPNYYILGEWFLGAIVIFYCIFPILRKLVIQYPKILVICSLSVYFLVVETYSFDNFLIDYVILARLPEFLFGMYLIRYINKLTIYYFSMALIVSLIMLFIRIDINYMYLITITGISLFIVIAFIGQNINMNKLQMPFKIISKYSFAMFLIHHVILEQILVRFHQRMVSPIETYSLFILNLIILAIMSRLLVKLTDKISDYFNRIKVL